MTHKTEQYCERCVDRVKDVPTIGGTPAKLVRKHKRQERVCSKCGAKVLVFYVEDWRNHEAKSGATPDVNPVLPEAYSYGMNEYSARVHDGKLLHGSRVG